MLVEFIEAYMNTGHIVCEVRMGDRVVGKVELTLDEWSLMRDEKDGSAIVALTASEFAQSGREVTA